VDHPLAAPDSLVRPWRTAAYVAGAVAAVELVLLLLIGGGKLVAFASDRLQLAAKERVLPAPTHVAPVRKTTSTSAPAARRPRSKTIVMVLNGNGRTGAAAAAASRIRSRGYRIGTVGNAPRPAARTLVMFKPGFAGEGRRLARDLHIGLSGPLDGMRSGALGRAQLVVILGP
jgi:hypothetical protein